MRDQDNEKLRKVSLEEIYCGMLFLQGHDSSDNKEFVKVEKVDLNGVKFLIQRFEGDHTRAELLGIGFVQQCKLGQVNFFGKNSASTVVFFNLTNNGMKRVMATTAVGLAVAFSVAAWKLYTWKLYQWIHKGDAQQDVSLEKTTFEEGQDSSDDLASE